MSAPPRKSDVVSSESQTSKDNWPFANKSKGSVYCTANAPTPAGKNLLNTSATIARNHSLSDTNLAIMPHFSVISYPTVKKCDGA